VPAFLQMQLQRMFSRTGTSCVTVQSLPSRPQPSVFAFCLSERNVVENVLHRSVVNVPSARDWICPVSVVVSSLGVPVSSDANLKSVLPAVCGQRHERERTNCPTTKPSHTSSHWVLCFCLDSRLPHSKDCCKCAFPKRPAFTIVDSNCGENKLITRTGWFHNGEFRSMSRSLFRSILATITLMQWTTTTTTNCRSSNSLATCERHRLPLLRSLDGPTFPVKAMIP
jgi:hypothetical protein